MKRNSDAVLIARRVSEFLNEYAPRFLTKSDHTLKAYKDAVSLFFQFLQEKGVTPATLAREHLERRWIEEWIAWLMDVRGNSPDTCNNRLASMRRFLEYLAAKDVEMRYLYLESKLVKRQKPTKRKVTGMSRSAVAAILAEPDTSTAIGRRDLVFLVLLYSTAARLDEVRSLTIGQIHLDAPKPYINIHGKGQKMRTAYLLPRAVALVRAYVKEVHGAKPAPDDLLFSSRVGGGGKKLTEAAWDKRIKKYAAAAHAKCRDVPEKAHAHQLRHAKASHWIEDGLNIVEVQFLLGHEQLETTMRYLDITTEEKAKALATLEGEKSKSLSKKWKVHDESLVGFCGLRG